MSGRRPGALVVMALTVACIGGSGCAGVQSALNPAGPQARSIASLTWWFFAVCGVVYVLVIGSLFWALFRKRSETDDGEGTHRRLAVIISAAVAVTIGTVVALTISSVAAGRGLLSPSAPGAITVDAIGHQWWWEFQYHDVSPNEIVNSPNELHIPVGVPVVIKAMSRDVIHSFWVPNLHGKRDLIPGMTTHTWIQADQPGVYRGQCAEFCGQQHANMAFSVVAEPMEDFLRWLQHQRTGARPPETDEQRRGRDVFLRGPCVMCHTIRGTSAGSRVGPDLTHVASRHTIAAGTLPNTSSHRAGWVADSQAIKPGNRMPANLVRGDDLRAVLAYLETLR
jgi:cytochrome c oxidase subunit II